MPKQKKIEKQLCQVCQTLSTSVLNFGSISCRACAAFFRRTVISGAIYSCNCEQTGANKKQQCKGCRQKRCAEVGMKIKLVRSLDLQQFRQVRQQNEKNCGLVIEQKISSGANMDIIQSLCLLQSKQRQIRDADPSLALPYLEYFNSLEKMLSSQENILSKGNDFANNPPAFWDRAEYEEQWDKHGWDIPGSLNFVAVDFLLIVEMAKALPFFLKLSLNDQMLQLKHVALPLNLFIYSFYATQICAETFTNSNGTTFITFFENHRFKNDTRILQLGRKLFCDGVDAFKNVNLDREEFSCLLALFYSNIAAPNLTGHAREVLYGASVGYSKSLLAHCQWKLGESKGASRFAEIIQTMPLMFAKREYFQLLFTYVEIFYMKRRPQLHLMRGLQSLYHYLT